MSELLLIYKGDGSGIPNVPARDIYAADVERFDLDIDELAKTPLYKKPPKPAKKKDEVKDGR